MGEMIPEFDIETVFVEPWMALPWVAVLGFLVVLGNGAVGSFLVLRRMSLVGDAISHSVLPGIVIAYLVSHALGGWPVFVGALVAGLATAWVIEVLSGRTRLKEDAATGIAFTVLFALGVILVSVYSGSAHIDTDCVLYGELGHVAAGGKAGEVPGQVWESGGVALLVVGSIAVFYKTLVVASFDPGLASSLGINVRLVHYGLMGLVSLVVVASFEAVGSILVVAMLVLPGATGLLLSDRLPWVLGIVGVFALVSSVAGFHLAYWLNVGFGPGMVVAGFGLFCLAWVWHVVRRRWMMRADVGEAVRV